MAPRAFLREEGGTRSVTEGACVALDLQLLFVSAGKPSPAEEVPRNEAEEESTERRN